MTPPEPDPASTLSGGPGSVARIAGEARDPRTKGIVLSRLFGREVEPERIGRYVLLHRLGEGGMGVVYAAYDDQLDRKVAVKVLRSWMDGDPARPRRLLQEARALAKLSHPNIVTVHEVGSHQGEVFVAMEHVRGESLDRWLAAPSTGPRPWPEVVEVFAAAGRGLAAAHHAGIVHRDFKPHNVIVGEDGTAKVLDFGLARVQGPSATRAPTTEPDDGGGAQTTHATSVLGTPAYMAPEQATGAPADERSDQFSFFVSLYQALYRELPFPIDSMAQRSQAIADGRIHEAPPGSTVPRWLRRAVLVGLSTAREERYPSMEAALAAILRDPSRRRRRIVAGVGALVVVATASAAIATQWASSPAPTPCEHGADAMAEAWSEQARAEIGEAMLASGLPFADETWSRLEPRLDAHARAWSRARDEACEQHRDGASSAERYDRQVVCLERRRVSFEALLGLLRTADRGVAERALVTAAGLPAAEPCLRAEVTDGTPPPPEDPELAAAVEAERRRLARVRELEALGLYAEGLEQARAVVATAERLGHRPLQAEALVRAGSIAMEHEAPERAEQMLTEALAHALATDHVEVATEAAARRLFVRAERMRNPERAVDDVTLGTSLLERIPERSRLGPLMLNNVGAFHIRRGDYDQARRVLERALAAERAIDPDDPAVAQTLGNLSIAATGTGSYSRAREVLEQALALSRRVLGPHHPTTTELGRQHGNLLLRTGYLPQAQVALEAVVERLGEALGPDSPQHHEPLVLLGEVALERERYDEAEAWFERAAALGLSRGEEGSMYGVLERAGLARAWWGQGDAARGRAELERLAAAAEANQAPYAAALWELLGRTSRLHGEPQAALEPLRRARRLAPGSAEATAASLAEARALVDLGSIDEAEAVLDRARVGLDSANAHQRAAARIERSAIARARGRREVALAHARSALTLLESWGPPEHPERQRARAALEQAERMPAAEENSSSP